MDESGYAFFMKQRQASDYWKAVYGKARQEAMDAARAASDRYFQRAKAYYAAEAAREKGRPYVEDLKARSIDATFTVIEETTTWTDPETGRQMTMTYKEVQK